MTERKVGEEQIDLRERIVKVASNLIGKPAVKYDGSHKGLSPETGFDCSGFVLYVLNQAGVSVPDFLGPDGVRRKARHANEFLDHFGVLVQWGLEQPGDLVFYSWDGIRPQHVGIVVDSDHFIHAHTSEGEVRESILSRRGIPHQKEDSSIYNLNPIGFKRPTVAAGTSSQRWTQRLI